MRIQSLSVLLALSLAAFGCAAAQETGEMPGDTDVEGAAAVTQAMTVPPLDGAMQSSSLSRTAIAPKTSFGAKLADAGLTGR